MKGEVGNTISPVLGSRSINIIRLINIFCDAFIWQQFGNGKSAGYAFIFSGK